MVNFKLKFIIKTLLIKSYQIDYKQKIYQIDYFQTKNQIKQNNKPVLVHSDQRYFTFSLQIAVFTEQIIYLIKPITPAQQFIKNSKQPTFQKKTQLKNQQQMQSQQQILSQTLYGDQTVLINDLYIKIFKYYFPLATSKTIFFNQIEQIVYHNQQQNSRVNLIWGAPLEHFNNWFPFDDNRDNKNSYFQIIMKDESFIRPSFTPTDPYKALYVIWLNHSKQGKQYKRAVSKGKQGNTQYTNTNQTSKTFPLQRQQTQLSFTQNAEQHQSIQKNNRHQIQQQQISSMILKDISNAILLSNNQINYTQFEQYSTPKIIKQNKKYQNDKKTQIAKYQNFFYDYDQKENDQSQSSIDFQYLNQE